MRTTICLASRSCLSYPEGGGYLWIFLNWALGFRSAGCRIVWLEEVPSALEPEKAVKLVAALKERLEPYGLADALALYTGPGQEVPAALAQGCLDLATATQADVLLNFRYSLSREIVCRFRRSVLMDIDPGLLQVWIRNGRIDVAEHDVYLTIGEHVREPGRTWHYVPPCVSLEWWPRRPAAADAPFTTVGHWYAGGWLDADEAAADKRSGFLPLLDVPRSTSRPLELALDLAQDDPQTRLLKASGWRVRSAHTVAATPWHYQRYVQESLGEFSCAKPAYTRLANAWISDRTLCYLASGKPAVVEHTGPSRFLPEAAGLFRFRNKAEAIRCIETVIQDYDLQCQLARQLAEEYFDASKVVARVLERAVA